MDSLKPEKLAELRRLHDAAIENMMAFPERSVDHYQLYCVTMHNALPDLLDAATPKPAPLPGDVEVTIKSWRLDAEDEDWLLSALSDLQAQLAAMTASREGYHKCAHDSQELAERLTAELAAKERECEGLRETLKQNLKVITSGLKLSLTVDSLVTDSEVVL